MINLLAGLEQNLLVNRVISQLSQRFALLALFLTAAVFWGCFFIEKHFALQDLVNEMGYLFATGWGENIGSEEINRFLKNMQGHLVKEFNLVIAITYQHYTESHRLHTSDTYFDSCGLGASYLRLPWWINDRIAAAMSSQPWKLARLYDRPKSN